MKLLMPFIVPLFAQMQMCVLGFYFHWLLLSFEVVFFYYAQASFGHFNFTCMPDVLFNRNARSSLTDHFAPLLHRDLFDEARASRFFVRGPRATLHVR